MMSPSLEARTSMSVSGSAVAARVGAIASMPLIAMSNMTWHSGEPLINRIEGMACVRSQAS